MKRYELNGLGAEWIYEAEDEEDATAIYLGELIHGSSNKRGTIEELQALCDSVENQSYLEIKWSRVYRCRCCGSDVYGSEIFCDRCED